MAAEIGGTWQTTLCVCVCVTQGGREEEKPQAEMTVVCRVPLVWWWGIIETVWPRWNQWVRLFGRLVWINHTLVLLSRREPLQGRPEGGVTWKRAVLPAFRGTNGGRAGSRRQRHSGKQLLAEGKTKNENNDGKIFKKFSIFNCWRSFVGD